MTQADDPETAAAEKAGDESVRRPLEDVGADTGVSNRLGSTLFIAALAHGALILGVTFTAGLPAPAEETSSIKVTLLAPAAREIEPSDETEYIANRDSAGSGSDDGTRPSTTPDSSDLVSLRGQQAATDLRDAAALEAARPVEQLVTRDSERRLNAALNSTETAADRRLRQASLLELNAPRTESVEIRDTASIAENIDDDSRLSPSARASILARYHASWRNRVERVGTSNFPEQFLRDANGLRPTVEVAIDPDGSLAEVVIKRSSGSRGLDQAALEILRMAAPFDPLPAEILDETGVLRFAYEWDFIQGGQGQ